MSVVKGEINVKGVQFGFVRRRYGRQMFTWLHWRDEWDMWRAYKGDPWPSVTIPRRDLERIADELLAQYTVDEPNELIKGIEKVTDYSPEGSIQE